jgi:hypothetical protein
MDSDQFTLAREAATVTAVSATTVEVQALNKPTNTRTMFGVRRMAMAVFLGSRLTLSDQDGIQCQVGYVVGSRYFCMGKGATEVQNSMGSYMEYAVDVNIMFVR